MPTIWTAPDLEISHYVTKSPATSIGAKGAGEDGSVGTTTVLLAAVEDALKPMGHKGFRQPVDAVECSPNDRRGCTTGMMRGAHFFLSARALS